MCKAMTCQTTHCTKSWYLQQISRVQNIFGKKGYIGNILEVFIFSNFEVFSPDFFLLGYAFHFLRVAYAFVISIGR